MRANHSQHRSRVVAVPIVTFLIVTFGICTAPLSAQDVSLGQILLPGEEWVAVKNAPTVKLPVVVADVVTTLKLRPEHVVVASDELAFALGQNPGRVYRIAKGKVQAADVAIDRPSALALSPDGGTLVVGDADSRFLWTYRVDKDGKLSAKEKYHTTQIRKGKDSANVTALTYDRAGRLYAATELGVQVFDLQGRLTLVIAYPSERPPVLLRLFFQDDRLHLVAADGSGIARRLTGTNPPTKQK